MIKGLKAHLARRGHIKIGGLGEERKTKGGDKFALPEKWDHFKITTLERDPAGRLIIDHEVMKHYGEKPKEINIIFFSNKIQDVYEDFFAYYTGRSCTCKGDGKVAVWDKKVGGEPKGLTVLEEDRGNGKVKVACCLNNDHGEDCPYISKDDNGSEVKCKPNAILRCLIEEAQSVGAVYEFRTTSWNTLRALRGSFGILERVTGGHMAMAGLPLKLRVSPKPVQKNGKARTVYVVHFEYPGSIKALRDITIQIQKQAVNYGKELVALSSSFEDSPEEIGEVVKEFYPSGRPAAGFIREELEREGKGGANEPVEEAPATVEAEEEVPGEPAYVPAVPSGQESDLSQFMNVF